MTALCQGWIQFFRKCKIFFQSHVVRFKLLRFNLILKVWWCRYHSFCLSVDGSLSLIIDRKF